MKCLLTLGVVAVIIAPAARGQEAPTLSKDLAPILYKNCVACHRPGEMGPMSLLTYADARPWAKSIRERVATRAMPPWFADPQFGRFSKNPGLETKGIETCGAVGGRGRPQRSP